MECYNDIPRMFEKLMLPPTHLHMRTSSYVDLIYSFTYAQRVAGIVDGYRRMGTFPQEGPSMANHLGEVRVFVYRDGFIGWWFECVFKRMRRARTGKMSTFDVHNLS